MFSILLWYSCCFRCMAWLHSSPVQYKYFCYPPPTYADQNGGDGCHSMLFEGLIPGLSLFTLAWSGFEPFFLSICQIWFYGLCKFWCAFGIETCFIFRSSLSGFVEHLFLNTRLTSEMLGTCLNSDLYSFLFLFSIVGYCNYFTARVSMPCALIVWLWLKDKAGVFSDSTYPCH